MPPPNFLLFNQMAGPLFRELACALAEERGGQTKLFTGHPDTLTFGRQIGNLEIVEMPGYNRRSKLNRLFSWLHFTGVAILKLAAMERHDTALIVSNPPTMGPVSWLARLFGRRYFVLVYDMFPDTLVSAGHLSENGPATKLWRWVNRIVWSRSEGVFTIGQRMADRLSGQFDAERTKLGRVEVIPLWADTDKLRPLPRNKNVFAQELGVADKTVVLYSGNMGFSHDIDSILKAAEFLSENDEIVFVLIGEGAKWQDAHDFMIAKRLRNLKVLPFQPESVLPMSLGMADIALVALDTGAEGLMIPSKTYYYMAAGAAIFAICEDDSELTDTIEAAQCGERLDPGRPERLAESIRTLAADRVRLDAMKDNARAFCVKHHDRAACTTRFVELLVETQSAVK